MRRSPRLLAALALASAIGFLAIVATPTSPLDATEDPPATEAQKGKPSFDWVPAIHLTRREGEREITSIIIHTIEGTARGCVSWFRNPKSKVSAHYVIDFDGNITQMVRDRDVAWHAGTREHNQHGIGIEHEGYAKKDGWTPEQMKASADLSRWLCKRYGIPIDRKHILGHNEIAPKRKSDPGPHFDWDGYIEAIERPGGRRQSRRPAGGSSADGEQAALDAARERGERALADARERRGRGEWAAAHRSLRRAIRLLDGTEAAAGARATLAELRAHPKARAAIDAAADRDEARNWLGLARGYLANGYPRRASGILERLIELHPDLEREIAVARELIDEAAAMPPSDEELDEELDAKPGR